MATPTTPEAISMMMDAAHKLLADPVAAKAIKDVLFSGHGQFMVMVTEPGHQFVRYDAEIDRVVYENPNVFYCTRESPSDCLWMVPGCN